MAKLRSGRVMKPYTRRQRSLPFRKINRDLLFDYVSRDVSMAEVINLVNAVATHDLIPLSVSSSPVHLPIDPDAKK